MRAQVPTRTLDVVVALFSVIRYVKTLALLIFIDPEPDKHVNDLEHYIAYYSSVYDGEYSSIEPVFFRVVVA